MPWLALLIILLTLILWFILQCARTGYIRYSVGAQQSQFKVKRLRVSGRSIRVGILAEEKSNDKSTTYSKVAITHIVKRLRRYGGGSIPRLLERAIDDANRAIANTTTDLSGASVVVALVIENKLYINHLGNCKAFLRRNKRLYPLTVGHTVAQDGVWAGNIRQEEIHRHTGRHQLHRWLGQGEWAYANDLEDAVRAYGQNLATLKIENSYLQLNPRDELILATSWVVDGVSATDASNIFGDRGTRHGLKELVVRSAYGSTSLQAILLPFKPVWTFGLGNGQLIWTALAIICIYIGGFFLLNNFHCNDLTSTGKPICMRFEKVASALTVETTSQVIRATATAVQIASEKKTADAMQQATQNAAQTRIAVAANATMAQIASDTAEAVATQTALAMDRTETAEAIQTETRIAEEAATAVAVQETIAVNRAKTVEAIQSGTRIAEESATTLAAQQATRNSIAADQAPLKTPTPVLTPTVMVAERGNLQIQFNSPEKLGNGNIRFNWVANSPLPEGTLYQLAFWLDVNNAFGLNAATDKGAADAEIDLQKLDDILGDSLEPGTYNWGVCLYDIGEKRVDGESCESGGYYEYQRSSSSGNNNNNNNNNNNTDNNNESQTEAPVTGD